MENSDERSYSVSFKDAVENSKKPNSCLFVVPVKERLVLQPCYLSEKGSVDEKAVAKDLLTPLLFLYHKKFEGIPISHGKITFSKDGRIHEVTGFITAFVTYQMVVFRPQANATLTAIVNKILPKGNCIGLLSHNFFNITCILPSNQRVEIGDERQVRIVTSISNKKSLQIKGVLLAQEGNTIPIKNIKQEVPDIDDSTTHDESLDDGQAGNATVEESETPKKKKRKSVDPSELDVVSEKKAKKKKIKVKTEVEDD